MKTAFSQIAFFCLLVLVSGAWALGVSFGVGGVNVGVGVPLQQCKEWTVILSRIDGSVDFDRNWNDYKNGFGNYVVGEYWLGNEIVHLMTTKTTYSLRVEITTSEGAFIEDYEQFSLGSEAEKYAIHLSGAATGNAGDSLSSKTVTENWNHNGNSFSTPDSDNDRITTNNCASQYHAGWWFNNCWMSCLTCPYGKDFAWESLKNLASKGVCKSARMIIYRK